MKDDTLTLTMVESAFTSDFETTKKELKAEATAAPTATSAK